VPHLKIDEMEFVKSFAILLKQFFGNQSFVSGFGWDGSHFN
jgi:hypothetical protein